MKGEVKRGKVVREGTGVSEFNLGARQRSGHLCKACRSAAVKFSPETVRGSCPGKCREISGEILVLLFPQETKLESAQNFSRQISRHFSRDVSRTVFANEKTHLGPALNTCKVGAWRAALKNFHSLLFSAQRLVHVRWCTLGAL